MHFSQVKAKAGFPLKAFFAWNDRAGACGFNNQRNTFWELTFLKDFLT